MKNKIQAYMLVCDYVCAVLNNWSQSHKKHQAEYFISVWKSKRDFVERVWHIGFWGPGPATDAVSLR